MCTGHQGFLRACSRVDPRAPEQVALDDRNLRECLTETQSKEWPSLACADDDCVEAAAHGADLWLRVPVRFGQDAVS
jgi:hypothetical protein